MIIALILILVMVAVIFFFMRQPSFGNRAHGERLEKIRRSPNFRNGQFQNLSSTPSLSEEASYYGIFREFFFGNKERRTPSAVLPSKKTDLFQLDQKEDVLVWFGHSSYFLQTDGKKILVDPVLSGNASPVKFTTRSFKGSDVYTADEIPEIDYLFISHDHWDHLDYDTMIKLRPKIKMVITGLGVGAHLESWGFPTDRIIEKDWNEELKLADDFVVHTMPARHFSGRGFKRNTSLWLSFVLITPSKKIYLGGDSGYDSHFATIGERFGPFDLAILENGQYNKSWKYIHMMPEEVVQAALDLGAKKLFPVHWSKFSLSIHAWDEPITRVVHEANKRNVLVLHPLIGEKVAFMEDHPPASRWWDAVR
jgi:L-ascorbate metabolism protein UlaG (beta-lactamase superfamily)